MHGLPPDLESTPKVSGFSCPECRGVLEVRQAGRDGALQFICRVGHTFATTELLAAKEELIALNAWTTLTAFAELIALLTDLDAHAASFGRHDVGGPYDERIASAGWLAERLRQLLEANAPLTLRSELGSEAP